MRLRYQAIGGWPALAWLATLDSRTDVIEVRHGPGLETRPSWFCEAVWAGTFDDGSFDRTDLVFGSGGRLRDDDTRLVLVPSGATVDRLVWTEHADGILVSNSLPALLARTGGAPDPTSDRYRVFFGTISGGLRAYERVLPTTRGPVHLRYFHDLHWDGTRLTEVDKPDSAPDGFETFDTYRDYLTHNLQAIARNAADPGRGRPRGLISTISSGYDSTAAAILGRSAGVRTVVTCTMGRRGRTDSGESTASRMSLTTVTVGRDDWRADDRPEIPFLVGDARGQDVFLSSAGAHLQGQVLLTGFHGDRAWAIDRSDPTPDIVRQDPSGLSLTEYRLRMDFIHLPVPFMGIRHVADLVRIGRSAEMAPWSVGGHYDRPIPRRIIEDAGVPRGTFAVEKAIGSVRYGQDRGSLLSDSTRRDLRHWLDAHARSFLASHRLPPSHRERLERPTRAAARIGTRIERLGRRAPVGSRPIRRLGRRLTRYSGQEALLAWTFPWAIERAQEAYRIDASGQRS